MVKNTGKAMTEFLEYIKKEYAIQPSVICERAGLNSTSARKWAGGTNPYRSNVFKIRDFILEEYPNEVAYFDSLLGISDDEKKLNPAEVGPDDDISTQIKALECVLKSRFSRADEETIKTLTEGVTRQLIAHGYEHALRVAKEVTIRKSELDEPDLPTEVVLTKTEYSPVTFKIEGIDGFYIDVMRTPHDSIAYYLWHEYCGEKMLFFDIEAVKFEKCYKTIEEGTQIITKDYLLAAIMQYYSDYFEDEIKDKKQ